MTQALTSRDERIKRSLAEWIATPNGLRNYNSLDELAEALGLEDAAELYALGAGDAEWNQTMLQAAASLVMSQLPGVVGSLIAAANKGSVRAAEVLLDWLRKTVQSHPSQVTPAFGSGGNVHNTLVMLSQGAGDLASLVAALGAAPENAEVRMKEWRSQQALNERTRTGLLLDGVTSPPQVERVGEVVDPESPFNVEPTSSTTS